ncbi:LysE family translocator [Aliiroseovarius crassostreae]|uniref:LysE family translocator n=1 Tax=Aliiroseovarius crassostreae TaxID=154981 RepID=UPI002202F25E|nr:LysE family translocator [Aliiroseovarius crassostreae]UWP90877.1 LysE family translocator [Aliiroseovarius crassostreae]
MSIEFLVTAFVVCLAPGTGVVFTLACAISHGRQAAFAAALGGTLGTLPHLAAGILGLAAILQSSPLLYMTLQYAGLCYLLYLAWQTLRDRSTFEVGTDMSTSLVQIVKRGVVMNILNPKLSMFFFAFLPQFVDANAPRATQEMLLLGGMFTGITFVVFIGYGMAAVFVRSRLLNQPRVMATMRYVFALCFVGLGARLVLLS